MKSQNEYRKVASSNTSPLEVHAEFFRLLLKGIFGPYVLWPLDKKLIFWIVTRVSARDYAVVMKFQEKQTIDTSLKVSFFWI